MEISLTAIYGTLFAGLATGLGALPILLKKDFSKATLDIGMGFSAGVMLVASFLSLIVPGINEAKEIYPASFALPVVLFSVFVGYLFIIGIHDLLPHAHLHKSQDVKDQRKLSRVMLIVMAISLHNFPEGLAVGVGFGSGDDSAGLTLALAIALQNMPEGLVVAIGMLSEGATRMRAFMMALLSGLVEPLAACLGFFSASFSSFSLPVSLGFAGGTMLFVICQEMLPELFREGHERRATFGVIFGVMVMLSLDFYF